MRHKIWLSAVAVAVASVLSAGPAFAHDCFIVNRSDTSSTQVGLHSKVWTTVFTLYDFLTTDPSGPGLSPGCATLAVDAVEAAHLPTVFATRNDTIIGENSHNPNLANAKGLDHFDITTLFNEIGPIVFALPCTQHP